MPGSVLGPEHATVYKESLCFPRVPFLKKQYPMGRCEWEFPGSLPRFFMNRLSPRVRYELARQVKGRKWALQEESLSSTKEWTKKTQNAVSVRIGIWSCLHWYDPMLDLRWAQREHLINSCVSEWREHGVLREKQEDWNDQKCELGSVILKADSGQTMKGFIKHT